MASPTGARDYGESFFASQERGSELSAARVVPEVLKILSPSSVIDVGCGLGTWAAAFQKQGIRNVVGVDGEYVNRARLKIAPDLFLARDLGRPIVIPRKFDLAVCLEVAEHLPPERGAGLVGDLAALAPAVLFSAAIPHQGGIAHLNEQWPDYWQNLFRERDYIALDCIRNAIWEDEEVEWWYRQNIILYAHIEAVANSPLLTRIAERQPRKVMRLVHPGLHLNHHGEHYWAEQFSLRGLLRELPGIAMRAVGRRIRKLVPQNRG